MPALRLTAYTAAPGRDLRDRSIDRGLQVRSIDRGLQDRSIVVTYKTTPLVVAYKTALTPSTNMPTAYNASEAKSAKRERSPRFSVMCPEWAHILKRSTA